MFWADAVLARVSGRPVLKPAAVGTVRDKDLVAVASADDDGRRRLENMAGGVRQNEGR